MALFGSKKNTKDTKHETRSVEHEGKKTKKEEKVSLGRKTMGEVKMPAVIKTSPSGSVISSAHIIIRPHITEKAGIMSEKNVYTFDVNPHANKSLVKQAIHEIYKVTPRKINIAQVKSTNKSFKGIRGKSATGKKAYVFLKDGDKIEFI